MSKSKSKSKSKKQQKSVISEESGIYEQELWKSARIPKEYLDLELDDFKNNDKQIIEVITKYITKKLWTDFNLVLYGKRGCGSTLMSVVVLKDFLRDTSVKTGKFIHAHELPIMYYKMTLSFETIEEYEDMLLSDLVVLDGIGDEGDISKKMVGVIKGFLSYRNLHELTTIVTSKYDRTHLERTFGLLFNNYHFQPLIGEDWYPKKKTKFERLLGI